ncbi:MAG: hypothetical protein KatS3mg087_1774 [Patescibacteria group bacterium]|nr:MAG: hypothetical protein KatS3mg087_1774 [Patescibacteria group bacterium]
MSHVENVEITLALLSALGLLLVALIRGIQRVIETTVDNKVAISQAKIESLEKRIKLHWQNEEQDLALRKKNIERVERLEKQLEDAQRFIDRLSGFIEYLERIVDERIATERKNVELEKTLEFMNVRIEQAEAQIAALQKQVQENEDRYQETITNLKAVIKDYQEKINNLHERLKDKDAQLVSANAYVEGIQRTLEVLSIQIEKEGTSQGE